MLFEEERPSEYYRRLFQGADQPDRTYKKNSRKIHLYPRHIVKTEQNSFKKRLSRLYGKTDGAVGHRGILGEAVNTMVANLLGIPSHQLCALVFNPITGTASTAYERIVNKKPAVEVLSGADVERRNILVKRILRSLVRQIRLGPYYHPDYHLLHIFMDESGEHIQLIDFERSIRAGCAEDLLFIAMASKLYRYRMEGMISLAHYLKLIQEVATEENIEGGASAVSEKIKEMLSLSREEQRARRYKMLGEGEVSVTTLLKPRA